MEMELQERLAINEIYFSVQGESTWAGLPCVFVRLTGCDLRCSYCDTEYAFYEGNRKTLGEVMAEIDDYGCELVEITGGEPLLQKNVHSLMRLLCDQGKTVLIETSGAHDVRGIDSRVHRIVDMKCPSSGMEDRNFYEHFRSLEKRDEVKFVLGSREDYEWACEKVREYDLENRVGAVLFSVVFGKLSPKECVEWILKDGLRVRFQLQMHKFIWPPEERGV